LGNANLVSRKEDILNIFPNADITIIPNGVDLKSVNNYNILSKKDYIKILAIDTNRKIIYLISMGRLHKVKGFDILISSFSKIINNIPNSILIIAGPDEGEKENLLKIIKELSMEKNIFIIESISGQDKIDFLANADLFVLPSHNENFGNVYIESLASGTPIVASTNTPWQEVEEYNCGKWVKNNIEETSKAILEMLNKDREVMRNNAKKLATKYDWKSIAKEFKKLYKRLYEL